MIWEIDDGTPEVEGLDAYGRPDPAYAASLGLLPARTVLRVLAALLEGLVAAVIALPALIMVTPLLVQVLSGIFDPAEFFARDDLVWIIVAVAVSLGLMIAYVIVQLVMHGRKGVTLGKAVCGIRSVNVRTLERPGVWRGAVVRYLVASASFIVPFIGFVLVIMLSPLFDIERRGRGWLDLAAATWFVDVRGGLNPYDMKRMRIARKRVNIPEHEEKAALPSLATPVHRDASAEYVPTARFSGGVIGAHLSAPVPATEQPAAPAPGAMVSAVPPSLTTGSPAPAPSTSAPSTSVPAPTPAPASAPVPSFASPTVAQPPAPSAAPAVAQPSVPGGVRAILVLDTGERVEVRGTTLFGRSPSAVAGEDDAHLVPVNDDTRSVSKTHIAVMLTRRGVFVVDRASTNGSAIVRGSAETALSAGRPAELQIGDSVRFGDRFLQVEWL